MKKRLTPALPIMLAALMASCAAVEEAPAEGYDAIPADVTITLPTETEKSEPVISVVYPDEETESSEAAETAENPPEEEYSFNVGYCENDDCVPITDIELTYYSVTLDPGDNSMPIVTMYPEDAPDKSEIWTSSDEKVATVDWRGDITAVSGGTCVIRVRSAVSPDVYADVEVTVNRGEDPPAETETSSLPEKKRVGLTYVNGILIANKTYPLPSDYNPGVNAEAQAAFDEMQSAAAEEGLNMYISSGFRSYDYQAGLYQRYVDRSGKAEADRYSARAGHSEHQTGLAFDLNSIDISFADTDEYVWLKKHCAEYGFIIRYPEDGESSTGYMYEPWHIRYLGKETARKVYDSGLTLEDYLGISSEYSED